jgi:hypothetical protein
MTDYVMVAILQAMLDEYVEYQEVVSGMLQLLVMHVQVVDQYPVLLVVENLLYLLSSGYEQS